MEKNKKLEKLFVEGSVLKAILKMSAPAIVMMLVIGLYTFADSILSINLANDEYQGQMLNGKDVVRVVMSAVLPITTFILAVTLLFAVGISTRFTINIGAGKREKAINTVKTGTIFAMITSVFLVIILFFVAKPWMGSLYDQNPALKNMVEEEGFKYLIFIIAAIPLQQFNQITSSLLRQEGRMRGVLISMIVPTCFNLLFDWIFMGPLGMGVDGGALATILSFALTSMILSIVLLRSKEDSIIKFGTMFSFKGFSVSLIIGVLLIGIAPFMRNMAQSITSTIEMNQIQSVSGAVYGMKSTMSIMMSAVFPMFGLFYPLMFGLIQGAVPVISYNYGAKNLARVKKGVWVLILLSLAWGTLIFLISTYALGPFLIDLLGVSNTKVLSLGATMDPETANIKAELIKSGFDPSQFTEVQLGSSNIKIVQLNLKVPMEVVHKSMQMYKIFMLGLIPFAPSVAGIVLFSSTDRLLFSILASTMRGLIYLVPTLLIFVHFTKESTQDIHQNITSINGFFSPEMMFWWFYPVLSLFTSSTIMILIFITLKRIDRNALTLEEKIERVQKFFSLKRAARKEQKQNK